MFIFSMKVQTQWFKFLDNWNFCEKRSRALDTDGLIRYEQQKFACRESLYVGVEAIHVC